ncbi:MAG: copper transporter [Nocardioidaceae bacterium]
MIDFRYHLVSIVAIFLALAAGVLLGAGPLSNAVDDKLDAAGASTSTSQDKLRAQVAANRRLEAFRADYADTIAPTVLSERLPSREVALFALPGADDDTVDGLAADVRAAGGSVTTEVELSSDLLDPAGRQFAEGVASQALDGATNVEETTGQSSYELVGGALGRAFLTADPGAAVYDRSAATIASAFAEAELISYDGEPTTRASLAVVVAGDVADDVQDGQDELVSTLVQALDATTEGVVLAGPPGSAGVDGYLTAVRERDTADSVSTVDVASSSDGQIVTVLVLAREAEGQSGHYGAVDPADGAMPELSGS